MKISGFTFIRNAAKFYYPIKESILSVLPAVDEFIVALGKSDPDDDTLAIIKSIDSDKIILLETEWDTARFLQGSIYAQQTDLARSKCTGDWLIYIQGDEVLHEEDIQQIQISCAEHLHNEEVEGLVLNYIHFWGDYNHIAKGHAWYDREVRIIKNLPQVHSWRDAQSFRFHRDSFDQDYFKIKNTRPLKCIRLNARVFHYGWVRPPHIIKFKNDEVRKNYNSNLWKETDPFFDFGRMDHYSIYTGSHPMVMADRIKEHNWSHLLRYAGPLVLNRSKFKHEKWKYKILTLIEKKLFGGKKIGGFKNYLLIR